MTTHERFSLDEHDFASLWSHELVQLRRRKPRDGYTCNSCEMKVACSSCPAFNYQENGHEDVKSEYVCETTRHRWDAIQAARGSSAVAEARRLARRAAARRSSRTTLPVLGQ